MCKLAAKMGLVKTTLHCVAVLPIVPMRTAMRAKFMVLLAVQPG